MINPYAIHWFRRDLRLQYHEAISYLSRKYQGRVLFVICMDSSLQKRADMSRNRFAFYLKRVTELKTMIEEAGGDLLILSGKPEVEIKKMLETLSQLPSEFTYSKDYEPYARTRDELIDSLLQAKKICCTKFRDHLVLEPDELLKADGTPYRVFTPFYKKWMETLSEETFYLRVERVESFKVKKLARVLPDITNLSSVSLPEVTSTIVLPSVLDTDIKKQLSHFKKEIIHYAEGRDLPCKEGTSRLSHYLKIGAITTTQIIAHYQLLAPEFLKQIGHRTYLKELVWREFYYSILYHYKRVESEAFIQKYNEIQWENNLNLWKAFTEGRTGFPLVDAGIRELLTTGHMHNRVRMVVASFLMKDLLIDWKWGEIFFMQHLLDGDLAANNGGWQWAASTGCDPQPYFRIFNPELQREKFDPDFEYIKKYIPEWNTEQYPQPIVSHKLQKVRALALYKK